MRNWESASDRTAGRSIAGRRRRPILKGVCDLYLHGAIESNTSNVHCAFDEALNESLKMQSEIYQKMEQKGWYPTEKAEQKKIRQVKQKFEGRMNA